MKLGAGSSSHCITLLEEISHHGPQSLSLVVGQHQVNFHTGIVCSLSPLLATLVKHSVEDISCTAHDHVSVFLPEMRNWKTVKHMKTFLSSGLIENISRLDIEDLQNLLELLGFSMSCEVQPALTGMEAGEDQEEQFYAEIKCEVEDDSDFSARIQLARNDYEELKNLITSGNTDLIDRNDEAMEDVGHQGKDETSEIGGNANETYSYTPYRNKMGAKLPQRKLPIRKTKNSFFEMIHNDGVNVRTEKDQWAKSGNKKCEEARKGVEYRCSECDYKSRNKGHFKRHHEAVHEGVKYPCNECGFKATQRRSLRLHVKSVHEGVRFPCNECDYEAKNRSILNCHVKTVHTSVRLQCNEWDYDAKYLTDLKWYQKGFQKKIQYPCNQCDHTSKYERDLKRHIQSVHDKIRYSCSKCDFKATRKSSIVRHDKRIHRTKCDFKVTKSAQ